MSQDAPPAKRRRITGNIINIVAGRDVEDATVESFPIHETVLRERSPFFKAALSKQWKEGQERQIDLPKDHPEIVAAYAEFLYDGKITDVADRSQFSSSEAYFTKKYLDLARLYILGEKLQDDLLCDQVISDVLDSLDKQSPGMRVYPNSATMVRIYEGTPIGSPFRKLVIDICRLRGRKEWLSTGLRREIVLRCPEFLLDLAMSFLPETSSPERSAAVLGKREDYLKTGNTSK